MVVFLLTCVLIMLMEGFCFWIVKQISLTFIIPWVMALCLGIRLGTEYISYTCNICSIRHHVIFSIKHINTSQIQEGGGGGGGGSWEDFAPSTHLVRDP